MILRDGGDSNDCSDCMPYNESKVTLDMNIKSVSRKKKFYTILEYTKIVGGNRFCKHKLDDQLFEGDEKFERIFKNRDNNGIEYFYLNDCEYKNCFFTCNHDYVSEADALVFHYGDFIGDLRSNRERYNKLIANRSPNQVWMLWNDEASIPLKEFDFLKFNWSVTFYTESEVWRFAYGGYLKLEQERSVKMLVEAFKSRKKTAIWFVSNCISRIRNQFASELGNYYLLRVGGDCQRWIGGSKTSYESMKCERDSSCEMDCMSTYKFYLAFESINCSDYITEKFWRSLSLGLIPVVLQPSKKSYERIAPLNSFIHAEDFNYDAKLLADYLEKVSNDINLYLKHLKWKITSKTYYKANDVDPHRLCQMCTKLNNNDQTSVYYESLHSWTCGQCKKD